MKQQKTQEPQQLIEIAPITNLVDDNASFASLSGSLSEIRKLKGVLGYILRNDSAAIIDLPDLDSDTLAEYAMLSSEVFDCSGGVAQQFSLTEVESVLVEGSRLKLLCMGVSENKACVFMDKTCAHSWIVKRILI